MTDTKKEPSCLNEIPFNLLVCNCGCDVSGEKKLERYKRDVQEMVIRRIEKRNKRLANVLKYKKSNKEFDELCKIMNEEDMEDFNITDEMIDDEKRRLR